MAEEGESESGGGSLKIFDMENFFESRDRVRLFPFHPNAPSDLVITLGGIDLQKEEA